MYEPLPLHAFAQTERGQQIAGPLLQDARAHTFLRMAPRPVLHDDVIDAFAIEQASEQQSRRTRADDAYACADLPHNSSAAGSSARESTRRSGSESRNLRSSTYSVTIPAVNAP